MTELSSPRQLSANLARRVLLVVALALGAAGVAFIVRSAMDENWESVAKVAFVEDTRFDYVEAERDRLVGLVEGQAVALVETEEIEHIEFFRPNRETFLDVEVVGSDRAAVLDTSNELADLIVAGDRAIRREGIDLELATRTAQLLDIDAEIALLEAEITEQAEREGVAEANRFLGGPDQTEHLTVELRDAQDQLYLATRYRNALIDRRIAANDRIAELDVQLKVVPADTRVVRPALLGDTPVGPTPLTAAVVAGVSVLALGALVLALRAGEQDS